VRNGNAVLSLLVALAALALFIGAGWAAKESDGISWLEAALAVPVVALLALLSLSFGTAARRRYQRTLGREGGMGPVRLARVLAMTALLLSLTAGLALIVFAVLVSTDGLAHAPW
jgi:hypothetical protein